MVDVGHAIDHTGIVLPEYGGNAFSRKFLQESLTGGLSLQGGSDSFLRLYGYGMSGNSLFAFHKFLLECLVAYAFTDLAGFDGYAGPFSFFIGSRIDHYREKDFDLTNFLNVLAPYYRGGEYDYLLNSDEQLDLLNKRFVVFEIDEIKEHKILFPVVTVIIMEAFINKMRRLHGVRKMIVVEEAWKAIAREGMADYIKFLCAPVKVAS